jgi:DNA repair exonuclease SbcCD nuclease subunit
MPFIVTADVHAHAYPQSTTLPGGGNKQLKDIIDSLDAMRLHAASKKCRDIIIVGDLFHDRKGVRPEASHAVAEWLERCQGDKIDVSVIVGNHDLSLDGECTSAKALSGLAHVYARARTSEIADGKVGFIPYTDDVDELAEALKKFKANKVKYVFAHIGIGDPKFEACVPTDYEVPGHINVSDLRAGDFAYTFLGHYHNPQTLGKRARYVGSPLQLSFKEVDQEKGFCFVSGEKVDFIVNTVSPRFLKMTVDAAKAELKAGKVRETDALWVTGADRDDREEMRAYADKSGSRVRVELARDEANGEIRIDPSQPENVIIRQYVDSRVGDRPSEFKDTLAKVGIDLLTKAQK